MRQEQREDPRGRERGKGHPLSGDGSRPAVLFNICPRVLQLHGIPGKRVDELSVRDLPIGVAIARSEQPFQLLRRDRDVIKNQHALKLVDGEKACHPSKRSQPRRGG